jgi:hypothetical protein
MVQHVINKRVLEFPYWAHITVNQIIWGGGPLWKDFETNEKLGLISHSGLNRPTNMDLLQQAKRYGQMLLWPPQEMHDIVTQTIKTNFTNPAVDATATDYLGHSCKGKICNKTGYYLPEFRKKITTYFFWNTNEDLFSDMQKHIAGRELWERKQWRLCLEKLPEETAKEMKIGEKKYARGVAAIEKFQLENRSGSMRSLLLEKLDPEVPDNEIDWRYGQEDDENDTDNF